MRGRRLWVKSALEIVCSSFPGSALDWSENSNYEADMYVLLHLAVWSSRARCLHSPAGSRRNSSSADTRSAFLFLFESPALSWSIFCTYILNMLYIFHRGDIKKRYVILNEGYLESNYQFLLKKWEKSISWKTSSKNQLIDYTGTFANVHRVQLGGVKFLLKLRLPFATSYIAIYVKMRDFIKSSVPGNAHLWIYLYLHMVFSVSWGAK